MGRRIFTIGHSNHPMDKLIELLARHRIEVVVDTRSSPRATYATHFDREPLQAALASAGIRYLFLGAELGGRPKDDRFYDAEGHVRYDLVAASPPFLAGIERLQAEIDRHRIALLCGEENPAGCHRRLLIARVLTETGVDVQHIRADGSVQSEAELKRAEQGNQLSLFEAQEPGEWKSIPSVSRRKRQNSFSTF